MKIRPVGAELFHADGCTDMTKVAVAFRNFAKAPKKATPYVQHETCIAKAPMTTGTGIQIDCAKIQRSSKTVQTISSPRRPDKLERARSFLSKE